MKMERHQTSSGITMYRQYRGTVAKSVFYLPGHRNLLGSPKAELLERLCTANHIGLTHLAYYGWDGSVSPQVPEQGEGYIRAWVQQAVDILDRLTEGPQILVGYSMGGYLALAVALARPHRVAGIIGLAAGFGASLCGKIQEHYGERRVTGLQSREGFTFKIAPDGSLPIGESLPIACPLRLAHSMGDEWVNYRNTFHIAQAVASQDVVIQLGKDGSHRLDAEEDAVWLERELVTLCQR